MSELVRMHQISLTIGGTIRDREGAARIHSARDAAHAVSLTGGAMVRRAYRQRSLVEVLLPDADKLWDAPLRKIDRQGNWLIRPSSGARTPDKHCVNRLCSAPESS